MDNPKIASNKNKIELVLQVMEITSLNDYHKKIIKRFEKNVDHYIYEITEDQMETAKAFKRFSELKYKARKLHNLVGSDIDVNDVERNEWVFMLPKFLLFGALGFATALKNESNTQHIDECSNELFVDMTETIKQLNDMLDKYEDETHYHDIWEYFKKQYKK